MRYPTDMSDLQWQAIERLIPAAKPVGAERITSMRAVVNAILYRRRSGCPWRMLPHDFPHWRTIYGYFRRWEAGGDWQRIETALREAASLFTLPAISAEQAESESRMSVCE
jgi:putative transposase